MQTVHKINISLEPSSAWWMPLNHRILSMTYDTVSGSIYIFYVGDLKGARDIQTFHVLRLGDKVPSDVDFVGSVEDNVGNQLFIFLSR